MNKWKCNEKERERVGRKQWIIQRRQDYWQKVSLVDNNCSEFSEKCYLYIFFISLEFLKILKFYNGSNGRDIYKLSKKSEKDSQKKRVKEEERKGEKMRKRTRSCNEESWFNG